MRIELCERGPTTRVFTLADDRYAELRATGPDEPLILTEPFAVTVDLAALGPRPDRPLGTEVFHYD